MKNKWLFDLLPVILFFIAFKLANIYTATTIAIITSIGQIGWLLWRRRSVDTMQWISLAIIVIFGSMTLLLHDESFIKWKPTILYWCMAAGLAISSWLGKAPLRQFMGKQIRLPDPVWQRLDWLWCLFFSLMGGVNLWMAYHTSTDTWVNFKLFGTSGALLLFILAQGLYLGPHIQEDQSHETDS
ncbi:MAG: septation protein A [Lautropia sp.]|nr:septation protein A [Lautropia sp.]